MTTAGINPYLVTQRGADAVPAILHPLVLLSITDHITRHTIRDFEGPVVGALLGKQNGRQVTLEHTFDFNVAKDEAGEAKINTAWFRDRLEQMRTVHKDRQLDLVGWYTVLNRTGPTPAVLQVHEQILAVGNEEAAAMLLVFHPEDLAEKNPGGRLPVTVYETHYEQDEDGSPQVESAMAGTSSEATENLPAPEDEEMTDHALEPASGLTENTTTDDDVKKDKGPAAAARVAIRFREIPYTVETTDAERISIDFVARGAANAMATNKSSRRSAAASKSTGGAVSRVRDAARDRAVVIESGNRSKRRLVAAKEDASGSGKAVEVPIGVGASASSSSATASTKTKKEVFLSREDEELIATLTARANAIRMLHVRLKLLVRYLEALPGDAVSMAGQAAGSSSGSGVSGSGKTPAHEGVGEFSVIMSAPPDVSECLPILRAIQALVQRLPLVVPPPVNGLFEEEQQREANDVQLTTLLLDDMMESICTMWQAGERFAVLQNANVSRRPRRRLLPPKRTGLMRAGSGP